MIFTIIKVVIVLAMLFLLVVFILPLFRGAPFVSASAETVDNIVALAQVKAGEKAADLGSGDGRIVIALVKAGAEAHGYEVNPLLVWLSNRKIKKAGLANKAFIHWQSFWSVKLSSFQVVVIFGIKHIMPELEFKVMSELKPGSRVITYAFGFPTWSYSDQKSGVSLYQIK